MVFWFYLNQPRSDKIKGYLTNNMIRMIDLVKNLIIPFIPDKINHD
jgi:hypothetical protein